MSIYIYIHEWQWQHSSSGGMRGTAGQQGGAADVAKEVVSHTAESANNSCHSIRHHPQPVQYVIKLRMCNNTAEDLKLMAISGSC
jgi:hypothetical protein